MDWINNMLESLFFKVSSIMLFTPNGLLFIVFMGFVSVLTIVSQMDRLIKIQSDSENTLKNIESLLDDISNNLEKKDEKYLNDWEI